MAVKNNTERSDANGFRIQTTQNAHLGWKDLTPRHTSSGQSMRRKLLTAMSVLFLIALTFAALRVGSVASDSNDSLQIRIGSQQGATLDLRQVQSSPISQYLLGTNIFPLVNTNSEDGVSKGFMKSYTPFVSSNLRDMHVKLLRYPGGTWGEDHILSHSQLDDFSRMLIQTGSDGMLQAHITGPVGGKPTQLTTNVASGATFAGSWVDYMNNPHSTQRTDTNAPFHPVKFWTVGNEPDQLQPHMQKKLTVEQYVNIFIQYSIAMHQNDRSIKVFGPEISQFYGIGAGPFDDKGEAWMEGFLKGVGNYERTHTLPFSLLDGVSLHRYQFNNTNQAPAMLMSGSDEWNYLLPPLRSLIKQDIGRDLPVGVTEINTNPSQYTPPSKGQAALWWADTLGTLMNQQVDYVGFFSVAADVPHPYPLFDANGTQLTAMGRVMQLFSHLQRNLVPLSIQRDPVSVYATEDDTGQTLSLLFINKSYDAQIAQIQPTNQIPFLHYWPTQDTHLAPNSMVVLTLHRGQPDASRAYSLVAQTLDEAQSPSIVETVCGHSRDPLSPYIPC